MRKALCCLAVWLAFPYVFATAAEELQDAVPRQDLFFPAPTSDDLGWTSAGTEYDLLGHSPNGYNVLLHRDGKPVVAQIPFRDEWGRPTADSSEIKINMAEQTIQATGASRFKPGVIVLKKGTHYPASQATDGAVTVHYRFLDLAVDLAVAGSDVAFPVSPEAAAPPEDSGVEPVVETDEVVTEPVPAPEPVPVTVAEAPQAAPPAEEAPKPPAEIPPDVKPDAEGKLRHAGVGAKVTVSSTRAVDASEGQPEALVDGVLATRWSSQYAEPQHVILEFEKPIPIRSLRLYWETASATRYAISVSPDGQEWKPGTPIAKPVSQPAPRTDDVPMNDVTAKAIRLDLVTRVNPQWGFSLFEIEVISP